MTSQPTPLTDQQLDLDAIETAIAAYRQHPDLGFACCSAHLVADHGEALLAEVRRLRAELATQRADTLREAADICDEAGSVCGSRGADDAAGAAFALMERFQRKANEAEYVATPCSVGGCDPGGEPCSTHERLMAHAEGDHELCAPDCGLAAAHMPA